MELKKKQKTGNDRPSLMDRNTHQIQRITWIGLLGNFLLSIIKFIVGWLGGSQAVIADAVHSISDMATDCAVLFGVRYWSAPPDDEHPYGHRRIEAVITSAIGITLALVALEICYKALTSVHGMRLRPPEWIAVTGPIVSIIAKELLYRWTIIIGKRAKSPAVIANAWHHRSDALSSLPALVAVVLSAWNPAWAYVDHLGAIIVSIFIFKVAWDIVRPSISELIDHGASKKELERIRDIACNVRGVRNVHAIRTRKFGDSFHVDLHIMVDPDIPVRAGHEISEDVRRVLMERGPGILDVVIHIEPYS